MRNSTSALSFSIPLSHFQSWTSDTLLSSADYLLTSDLQWGIDQLSFPIRFNAFMLGVCTKGSLEFTVNMVTRRIEPDHCLIILPEDVLGLHHVSSDFEGMFVAISVDYLLRLNIDFQQLVQHLVTLKNYSLMSLDEQSLRSFTEMYDLLCHTLRHHHSQRKQDILDNLFSAMLFLSISFLDQVSDVGPLESKSKEYYFLQFLELLRIHFRRERKVGFYAQRLGITPKYLSTLIKEVSELSAAQWIDQYTLTEACVLLRFSNQTIQQVSEELNFATPSFFSKYFRQHRGVTPSRYRRDQNLVGK